MKTKNYISLICLLFIAAFMTGCAKDKLNQTDSGTYRSTLIFNVAQTISKAAVPAEDEVRRVDIMLFNEGVLEKVMRNITSFESAPSGQSSVDISFETEGVRKAYVVANVDDESWLNSLKAGQTTEEEVKSFRTAALTNMSNPPLVMYGVSEDITFSTGQNSVMCDLYRVVAKIDIYNKSTNFELKSARLIRSKVSSCIFPGGANNSGTQAKDFGFESAQTDNVVLYSYENSATELNDATAIEIKGDVNGADMTYIVDLVSEGNVLSLNRNFSYTVNVNSVQANAATASIVVKPWIIGNPFNETVSGNKPSVDVIVDPTVGTYTKSDSTVVVLSTGGRLVMDIKANAECAFQLSSNWIKFVSQTKASSIDGSITIDIDTNTTSADRTGDVVIINKISGLNQTIIVKQSKVEEVGEKYMVIVVAGQSNAVGYDQSPIDAEDLNTPAGALQLSYRNGKSPRQNLSIIPLSWCADDIDARKQNNLNESGQYGLKGIHLPLAKELLKYIPSDYKIVVVPVAYASSRFSATGSTFGTYNTESMQPTVTTSWLRWGQSSAYYPTIINRVKHILDMDERNKFLGVVWCQGENDNTDSDYHYTEFIKLSDGILSNLNAGYGNRSNFGVIDKRSWYVFSSTKEYVDWYASRDASSVFGGYKVWNPDTFVYVPEDYPANPTTGGAGGGNGHFGKNSYRNIAKLVAERMNKNGSLFNGVTPLNNHFTDKTTPAQAALEGGSMNDSDVAASLIISLPFKNSASEALVGGSYPISATNLNLVAATDLIDINGNPRNRNALSISSGYMRIRSMPASTPDWSMSFMFKRTGGQSASVQAIISPSITNSPFVGFKKYSPVMGIGKAAEFIVEPNVTNTKATAVPGKFMAANKVQSLDGWIHYAITYNNTTKETSVYMNGELVQRAAIPSTSISNLSSLYIGSYGSYTGAQGQMMDFCLWSKTLTTATVRKLFLMSYYGFTK